MILAASLTSCGGDKDSPTPPPVSVSPPPNSAPVLTGNFKPEFLENSDVIFTLNIEDADGDTVTVTIGDSQDGQFFTVDSATGEIQSTQQFDFENPQDENSDNIYVQTVTLDDGTTTVTEQVEVAILNEDEAAPECDILSDISVDENTTGLLATFSGTDQDPGDEAIAIYENLTLSQSELDGLIDLNPSTGQVSLNTPLDSEEFGLDFTFDITADYRTNDLFDTCTVTVALNDVPARITSGIMLNHIPTTGIVGLSNTNFTVLSDMDGDGLDELWLKNENNPDPYDNVSGTLIFGKTLLDAIQSNEKAVIDVDALSTSQKLIIEAEFFLGQDEADFYSNDYIVKTISDIDGDGIKELFFGDMLKAFHVSRRPLKSAYVVYSKTIYENESGHIFLDKLTEDQGISLSKLSIGNGGSYCCVSYVIADLDGVPGDEIAIAGYDTSFYVISNETLKLANGNIDFEIDERVKAFRFNPDSSNFSLPNVSTIGDIDGDNIADILSGNRAFNSDRTFLISSSNFIASSGGNYNDLRPLVLETPQIEVLLGLNGYGGADIDGDGLSDLFHNFNINENLSGLIVKGEALSPISNINSSVVLQEPDFNPGDFIELKTAGSFIPIIGSGINWKGVGDLDGDGKDEVAFTFYTRSNSNKGFVYIFRGSSLAGLTTSEFELSDFSAEHGIRIGTIPHYFKYINTPLSLAPDIDNDGLRDFLITSVYENTPKNTLRMLLIKSTDITAALNNNEVELDLEALFFNETPEDQ